jgi:hypothetical protein
MAVIEITFYQSIPTSSGNPIQVPGIELATTDSPTLVNTEAGGLMDVPANANFACFTPSADLRVAVGGAGSTPVAKKVAPKVRLFKAGVLAWIAVTPLGKMAFQLEV